MPFGSSPKLLIREPDGVLMTDTESFTNFGQCRSLRIGQPEPSGRCARRILFSAAKYSLLQQDLIRYSRHVREQPRHLRVLHGKAHHGLPLFPTPSDILTLRGQVNWIKRPLRRLYRTYSRQPLPLVAAQLRSRPGTWVTVLSGDMGDS
jgi:hypothetical protein